MYEHACIFINKLFTFWFMGIFYKAIMQKQRFGQAKCKDLIKGISTKFIYYTNLYEFWKFERISWKYLKGNEIRKRFTRSIRPIPAQDLYILRSMARGRPQGHGGPRRLA
jgi:hypothetical protein